uniref:Proline--tRNA ligase n=1 Tax=Fervidicoccus fontis TaxID=683846 RepID=A0A7J3ZIV6_9CREN
MEKPGPEEFSGWFDSILREAELYDYGRYPVKGVGVWMPYGFALRKNILEIIRKHLDSTGHEEILLPLLIPEDLLVKEEEHIRGFRDEVYWVTHGGVEELDVKYALRPTSETSISLMESYWLSSYKQLPKKYYQIVSVFRYETKATRAMIRLREVTSFKEAHTAHASFEDAERQVFEAVEIYKRIFDELGIPYMVHKRPDWDKFAGALYSIAFDTILPDGRALQIGTVHHLGQAFSKAIDVKVQLKDEKNDYVWQTSYGLSDRVIASVIAIHGDKRGLVLPFKVAPIQVILVPIPGKSEDATERVYSYVRTLESGLKECNLRVKTDWREDVTPGRKFYEWEQKGVPLRLEVGTRELVGNELIVARRDTLTKTKVSKDRLCEELYALGRDYDESLYKRAWEWFKDRYAKVESIEEARQIISSRRGIVELPWCGRDTCGQELERAIEAKVLGSPLERPKWIEGKSCPICCLAAVTAIRLAKTY